MTSVLWCSPGVSEACFGGGVVAKTEEILDLLRIELQFLEDGGYGRSTTPHPPLSDFRRLAELPELR